jgi:hypothetical protein
MRKILLDMSLANVNYGGDHVIYVDDKFRMHETDSVLVVLIVFRIFRDVQGLRRR